MDLSDANQYFYNKDVKNIGQRLRPKPISSGASVETSNKIEFKRITDDEMFLASHPENGYLQKETESYEIVADIWHSFNAFQRTINDVYEEDKLFHCGPTSAIVRSLNSCTFPVSTTSKTISSLLETSTSGRSLNVSKTVCSTSSTVCKFPIQTKLNTSVSTSSSFPTLSSTKPGFSAFKTDCRSLHESNNSTTSTKSSNNVPKCTSKTVPSITNIVGTPSNQLPDTPDPAIHAPIKHNDMDVESSAIIPAHSLPTTEPSNFRTTASPKFENISKLRFDKCWILSDFFKEDNDWDIYQLGITATESIPTTESSLESHFALGRLRRKTKKRLSKNNHKSGIDYDTRQRTSYIPPVASSSPSSCSVDKGSTFPEYNEDRLLKEVRTYFLENPIQMIGKISKPEQEKWISSDPYFSKNFALAYGQTLPNTTPIQEPNLLEELKDNELIQGLELSNHAYKKYRRVRLRNTRLREWFTSNRDKHLSQKQPDGTSDVISENNLVSPTYVNNTIFPRTTNQANAIKPLDVNISNSHNSGCKIKALKEVLTTNDSATDLSKGQ